VGHTARIIEIRNAYGILAERFEGRDHVEDLGVDRRVISKWI
jgi:hypothetical protein